MPQSESPLYLALDIGGTKTLCNLYDRGGAKLASTRWATPKGQEGFTPALISTLGDFLARQEVTHRPLRGLGVGMPGLVDPSTGVVEAAHNLELDRLPLGQQLSDVFGVPVTVGNDVNLGTLAEAWLGAGVGQELVLGVFIGTGLGGGIVLRGRPIIGATCMAGEFGHICVEPDGAQCTCGNKGCVEAYTGKWALERDLRAAFTKASHPGLAALTSKAPHAFGDLLRAGIAEQDPLILPLIERATHKLGMALMDLRHCFDPHVIVLGGGIWEAIGDYMLPRLLAQLQADPIALPEKVLLERAQLGEDAVALGAMVQLRLELGEPVPGATYDFGEHVAPYPRLDAAGFGRIEVNGELVEKDFYVFADGTVKKRDKKLSRKQFGTSHMLGPDEVRRVLEPRPRRVFVGTGYNDGLSVTEEARHLLEEEGIELTALPTPAAIHAFNSSRDTKALLVHVTC